MLSALSATSTLRIEINSDFVREGPIMTTNHARSCLLSAAMALLSAACFSSSTTGGTGGDGGGGTSSSSTSSGAACQPATLVGAVFVGPGWQMAALDPATGTVTQLSSMPTTAGLMQGGSAYDPATKRLYLIGDDTAMQHTVYTIDGLTGATLATAAITDYTVSNPEVVAGGALLVLRQPAGVWKTATLDAATGTLTNLSSVVQDGFMASRGFDPRTSLLYEFGSHDGESHILTINGATGTLLLDATMDDFQFENAIVNAAGQILGMHQVGSDWSVAHLDPMTGAITNLAPAPLSGVYSGIGTFDPCTNHVYQLAPDGVLTADGTTGAVISLVPLPFAQSNFASIEAVW